ncbi:hypothetical protein OA57_11735, partial [Chelonobacter oris]
NDGLKFQGDTGNAIAKKLNETLSIKGNVAADAEVTDKNLRVDNVDGELVIKMAKQLTDLTGATFGNTVINNDGVTIANGDNPVSLSKDGLNNGGNVITNVAGGGDVDTNAANIADVKNAAAKAKTEVTKGTNIADVSETAGANGQTVYTVNADGVSVSSGSADVVVGKGEKDDSNVTDYKIDLAQTVKDDIKKGAEAKEAIDAQGLTFTADNDSSTGIKKLGEEVAFSGDDNITTAATADGVQVKLNTTLTGLESVTIGDVVINNQGIDAGDKQIKNVASAGDISNAENAKNAVNAGDLNSAISNVNNAIQNSTQQFKGDNDTVITRKPNEVFNIKGGATGETAANNIKTVGSDDGSIAIELAKDVDLGENGSVTAGNTGINNDGITIKSPTDANPDNTVSLGKDGLNNGGGKISNIAAGVDGKDAVNKDQLDALKNEITAGEKSAVVAAGQNTTVETDVEGNVTTYTVNAEKATVSAGNNGVKVVASEKDADGTTNYEISLDKDLVAGSDTEAGTVTVKGADGKDGISLNGADGTIGLNGKDGTNATIGLAKDGAAGVHGKDGESKTRMTYQTTDVDGNPVTEQVATLNDGLKFVGDNTDVTVARKLNETLAINGGATGDTTANNIKTIGNADGSITIELAKALTDLTSATFGDTIINNGGVTIANGDNPVSLTEGGLNNGGNKISNIADGVDGKDAVNKGQLDALKNEIAAGEKSAVV